MKELQLSPAAKARVWIHERATAGFNFKGLLQGAVVPCRAGFGSLSVGVEAVLPHGARAEYGMIGFEFAPDGLERLQCEVRYSDMAGPVWPDALAAKLDEVRLGLPEEYASAVMEALSSASQHKMPSGILRIVDAAHGMVGSSPSIFRRLTTVAVDVAVLHGAGLSDADLVDLLRSHLIRV